MSDERHETVSDIMAEMRECADSTEKHLLYDLRECATDYLRILADRIEDAINRQFRDVAKMIPHEEVDVSKMETTTPTSEKPSAVGNAAKMHEALRTLRQRFYNNVMAYQDRYFRFSGWHWNKKAEEAARWRDVFNELLEVVDAALSAPPRNCDVGTDEEQAKRFNSFCKTHLSGIRSICSAQCPFVGCRSRFHCLTKWSQMPYEEVKE